MANVTGTAVAMAHGLSESNVHFKKAKSATTLANNDTLTTVFSDMVGADIAPAAVSLRQTGSGSVGARTLTSKLSTWTWDEATGTLVVTNTSGGNCTLPEVDVIFVQAGPTPA